MVRKWMLFGAIFLLSGLIFAEITSGQDLTSRNASVKEIYGSATITKGDTGQKLEAYEGMILNENDLIETDAASRVDIIFYSEDEESIVQIYENTEIAIDQLAENKITGEERTVLDLAVGKVLIKAAKLKGESKFEVITPTSVVGVRGTEFEVSVTAPTD